MSDLPISIIFDKLGNVSRRDAEAHCRGIIYKYFPNPVESHFFIKKHNNEWYCEVQEGGNGEAFLPEIIKKIKNNEEFEELYVPSGTKWTKVVNDVDEGILFVTLTDDKTDFPVEVKRTSWMTPFQGDSRNFLAISVSVLVISFIVMIVTYTSYKAVEQYTFEIDHKKDTFSMLHRYQTQMERLPSDRYINKLEYSDGTWNLDIQKREVIKAENNKDNIFVTKANKLSQELKEQGVLK
jgi:hypothetical protein